MFKENYIHELEINFSNLCTANCIMCSRPHGVGNAPYMQPEVFNTLITQLKDVKTDIIQTSGDGETFLNPHYISYIRVLKNHFPDIPKWIYNNFSLFDKEKADIIINENLFEKVHTRVDSLEKWVFQRSSNLNQDLVFENIKYFLSVNDKVPFVILYNNIKKYYARCKAVLDKRPIRDYFSDEELSRVPDELGAIGEYFKSVAKRPDLVIPCEISHGLWGERYRHDIEHNPNYPCPKINVIEKVCWIYPNGNVGICCYEDEQREDFKVGNIMENHILDIFYSDKRKEMIENIKNNVYKEYPCNNPRLCGFGDGVEAK